MGRLRPSLKSSGVFVQEAEWPRRLSQAAPLKRQDSTTPTVFSDADSADEHRFCGWAYVAELPCTERIYCNKKRNLSRKTNFQLRYFQLNEIVCAIFASERDAYLGQQLSQHVVIHVEYLPERNKTFVVTDYEDRQLVLHTTMNDDFDECFEAFVSAIRSTQVAKTASQGRHFQLSEIPTVRSTESRMRSLTEPPIVAQEAMTILECRPRIAALWLYLKNKWWRRKTHSRRYFVLMGRTLSCFSVNKEGQRAQFSYEVLGCRYHDGTDAQIFTKPGRTLHVRATEYRAPELSSFIELIRVTVGQN